MKANNVNDMLCTHDKAITLLLFKVNNKLTRKLRISLFHGRWYGAKRVRIQLLMVAMTIFLLHSLQSDRR